MRSLSTDVIVHGKIKTTETRAKELRSKVEKLITLAKKNDLPAKRRAAAYLRNITLPNGKSALQHLFNTVGPKYKDRNGGYTRVIKLPRRLGDNSKMAIIELV
jgi:large subunit ribosomal protein L17